MMTKVNNKPTCRGHSMETLNTKKKKGTNKTKAAQGETKSKKKCSDRQQKTNKTGGSIKKNN